MDAFQNPVPVLRPCLPRADRLLPYLERIDASRMYSNHGPLACEFESRMAASLRLPEGGFVAASSGTAALVGAILGTAGPAGSDRPLALIPAYTFVATALAAEQCGYQPYLMDVSPEHWMVDPEAVTGHPWLDKVGLVLPVGVYGKGVPQRPWASFHAKTDIPVVIDGAASFEALSLDSSTFLGEVPVALSFHATKSFGIGEGGGVATTCVERAERVARVLNFGFRRGSHECEAHGTNAKMSEYHAAVGLAQLDGWPEKRAALHKVGAAYRANFATFSPDSRLHASPAVAGSYVLFCFATEDEAQDAQKVLLARNIGSRRWYGGGVHRHAHFASSPRDQLEITESLAARVLGLPSAPDLKKSEIATIAACVAEAIAMVECTDV